jgi:cell division transport system permease protein
MGIMSAIISFILISLAYVMIYARVPQIGTSMGVFGFLPYSKLWYEILIVYIILGLLIGIVGSAISIKRYLKA